MIGPLKTRLAQQHRTIAYPKQPPVLPERFNGLPILKQAACAPGCTACSEACPTNAIIHEATGTTPCMDLGKCLFCGNCAAVCPNQVIEFTREYRMAVRERDHAWLKDDGAYRRATELKTELLRIFKRSLRLRQVSAGGCNACEADTNVLSTVVFDLGRFGIQFVASPRHADGLLVTGPVSRNMELALMKTYEALPAPKLVIATGACAISGGIYADHPETCQGVDKLLPVDLFIPGCPPHPMTILDGLLRLLGRIK